MPFLIDGPGHGMAVPFSGHVYEIPWLIQPMLLHIGEELPQPSSHYRRATYILDRKTGDYVWNQSWRTHGDLPVARN